MSILVNARVYDKHLAGRSCAGHETCWQDAILRLGMALVLVFGIRFGRQAIGVRRSGWRETRGGQVVKQLVLLPHQCPSPGGMPTRADYPARFRGPCLPHCCTLPTFPQLPVLSVSHLSTHCRHRDFCASFAVACTRTHLPCRQRHGGATAFGVPSGLPAGTSCIALLAPALLPFKPIPLYTGLGTPSHAHRTTPGRHLPRAPPGVALLRAQKRHCLLATCCVPFPKHIAHSPHNIPDRLLVPPLPFQDTRRCHLSVHSHTPSPTCFVSSPLHYMFQHTGQALPSHCRRTPGAPIPPPPPPPLPNTPFSGQDPPTHTTYPTPCRQRQWTFYCTTPPTPTRFPTFPAHYICVPRHLHTHYLPLFPFTHTFPPPHTCTLHPPHHHTQRYTPRDLNPCGLVTAPPPRAPPHISRTGRDFPTPPHLPHTPTHPGHPHLPTPAWWAGHLHPPFPTRGVACSPPGHSA